MLDANVFASDVLGLHCVESAPGEVIRRWRARAFTGVTSEHLISEVVRTLGEPFFSARVPAAESSSAILALQHGAIVTPITLHVSGIATHPEDDVVLATAISGNAGLLVTGDRQLQELGTRQGVTNLSPAEFIVLVGRESTP